MNDAPKSAPEAAAPSSSGDPGGLLGVLPALVSVGAGVYLLAGTLPGQEAGVFSLIAGVAACVVAGLFALLLGKDSGMLAPTLLWSGAAGSWLLSPTYGEGGATGPGLASPGATALVLCLAMSALPLVVILRRFRWRAVLLVFVWIWAALCLLFALAQGVVFEDFPVVEGFWGDLPAGVRPANVLVMVYLPSIVVLSAVSPWIGKRWCRKRFLQGVCWGLTGLVTLTLCFTALRGAHVPSPLWGVIPPLQGAGETQLTLDDGTTLRVTTRDYDALMASGTPLGPPWRIQVRAAREKGQLHLWLNVIDARGRDVLDQGEEAFVVYVNGAERPVHLRVGTSTGAPPSFAPPYLWVANSEQATVSKLETRTGRELARYTVPPDPSRTAVDLNGDVFVASRANGDVTKIKAGGCAEAGCILWTVTSCAGARGLAVARDGTVWVGGVKRGESETGCLQRLDPADGKLLYETALPRRIYGLALDQKGHVWAVSDIDGRLLQFRGDGRPLAQFDVPAPRDLYGLAIDGAGRVWIGNHTQEGVWRFAPEAQAWTRFVSENKGAHARGVAADVAGNIWVANSSTATVSRFRAEDGAWLGDFSSGGSYPVGVAIDAEQSVWVVNKGSSTAARIDPTDGRVIGVYPTGKGPYTYSDMTGYALFNFVAAEGTYALAVDAPETGGTPE